METWDTPAYGAPASRTGVRESGNRSYGRPALAGCCPPPPWASVVGASWGTPCRKAPRYRAGTKSPALQGKPGPWASLPHPTAVSLTGRTGRATGPAAAARGPGTWPVRTEAVVTVWQHLRTEVHTARRGRGRGPSATAFSKWLIRGRVSSSWPNVVSSGDPASKRPGVTETTLLPAVLHWPLFRCSSQEHCLQTPSQRGSWSA